MKSGIFGTNRWFTGFKPHGKQKDKTVQVIAGTAMAARPYDHEVFERQRAKAKAKMDAATAAGDVDRARYWKSRLERL